MDYMNDLIQFIQMNNMIYSQRESFFKELPKEFLRPESEIKELTSKIYKVVNTNTEFKCLFPDCDNKPIKSHSIQKSLLKNIMDSTNHVLNFSLDVRFNINSNIAVKQKKIGINEASTFEGYCNKHDTEIFLPIEKDEIDFSNNEHNFLLLYRSVVREYYESRKSYFLFRDVINEINSSLDGKDTRILSSLIQLYLQFCEYIRIESMKKCLDQYYLHKEYSCMFKYKNITINRELPLFANTYFCVQGYKKGKMNKIDITKDLPYSFSITILPKNGKTSIFYTYLEEQEKDLSKFIKLFEAKDETQLQEFITDTILRNSDNFYISPVYWNKIPENNQNELLSFFKETISNREYDINNNLNIFKYIS